MYIMKDSPVAESSFWPSFGLTDYISTKYQQVKNWVKFSDFGIGFRQLNARMGRHVIQFLLNNNGFNQEEYLTQLALAARASLKDGSATKFPFGIQAKDGVAQGNLYLQAFGWTISPRLWTFQCYSGKDNLKDFSDVKDGARGFYEPPRDLALFDNFVCKALDRNQSGGQTAIQEKIAVKQALREDLLRLWLVIKNICKPEHLLAEWDDTKPLAFNMNMLSNKIVMSARFARSGLPGEIYELIEEFESHWHHPEKFDDLSIFEFIERSRKNRHRFKAISAELNKQNPSTETNNPYLPELKEHPELRVTSDIVETLFMHHGPTHHYRSKTEINTAGFLAMFGNLPKLISGAGMLILPNEKICQMLRDEIQRIDIKVARQKSEDKKENEIAPFFDALHEIENSEIFYKCYLEVIRYWFQPPFIPRLNTNLIFGSTVGSDGKHSLPARSLSIHADSILEREGFDDPLVFNPLRNEYKFKKSSSGFLSPDSEVARELLRVFNHEGSARLCPGKQYSYRIFCQVLYQWLHHDYKLKIKMDDSVATPYSYDQTAKHQKGLLSLYGKDKTEVSIDSPKEKPKATVVYKRH